MKTYRRIAVANIMALVVLAAFLLTACGAEEPAQSNCVELDIDRPKSKTAKPAAPKPAPKPPAAKAPSTRKR